MYRFLYKFRTTYRALSDFAESFPLFYLTSHQWLIVHVLLQCTRICMHLCTNLIRRNLCAASTVLFFGKSAELPDGN